MAVNRPGPAWATITILLAVLSLGWAEADAEVARQYVYVGTDGALLSIDPQTNAQIGSIPLSEGPTRQRLFSLAVTADGNLAYVLIGEIGDRLERVDLRTGQRAAVIDFGDELEPYQIALSPRGDRAYLAVAHYGIGSIQVLDLHKGSLLNRIVPGYPGDESAIYDMVISSDGRRLYAPVADLGDDFQTFVVAINTETGAVQRVPASFTAVGRGLVLRDNHTAYVGARGVLQVIDLDRLEVSSTIQLDSARADGLAIGADGVLVGWAWPDDPDGPTSTILTFDHLARLTHEIPIGGTVKDVVVRADGRAAYVSVRDQAELVVLDPASGKMITNLPLEAEPAALAIAPVPGPSSTPPTARGMGDADGCAVDPGARSHGGWSLIVFAALAAAAHHWRRP